MSARIEPLEPRRFLNAGQLDTTFGDAGHTELSLPGIPNITPIDFDVDSNGHAVVTALTVTGNTDDPDAYDIRLWRLRPDGSRDARFGSQGDGSMTLHVSPTLFNPDAFGSERVPRIHTHVTADDGLLIQIGNLLYKFHANGRPDQSFGRRGRAIARGFEPFGVMDATADALGRVIVIGRGEGDGILRLERLATNGKPDLDFGALAARRPIPGSKPTEMIAQTLPDGSILAGGIAEGTNERGEFSSAAYDIDVLKLTPDGAADPAYGADGLLKHTQSSTDINLYTANHPIITAAGSLFYTENNKPIDFGDVQATYEISGFFGHFNSLALAQDDDVLVATISDQDDEFGVFLSGPQVFYRTPFGGGADVAAHDAALASIDSSTWTPRQMAMQPDGSLLVLSTHQIAFDEADRLAVHRLFRNASPAGQLGGAKTLTVERNASYRFTVQWRDTDGVDLQSLGDDDVSVIFPDGVRHRARLLKTAGAAGAGVITATYLITSPDGVWDSGDNGRYQVRVERKSVRDTHGNPAGRRIIGSFNVQITPSVPLGLMPSGRLTSGVKRPPSAEPLSISNCTSMIRDELDEHGHHHTWSSHESPGRTA